MSIEIEAHEIVSTACSILQSAKDVHKIKTPKYTRSDFGYDIETKYKEALTKFSIPLDTFGILFGNKSRWDASLCRYFTLSFIEFFIKKTKAPHSKSMDILAVYSDTTPEKYRGVPLSSYTEQEYSEGTAFSKPHLYTADPRVISLKAFVVYPNTTLSARFGSGFMSKKWVNLRYELDGDKPKLAKLPAFKFDPTSKKVVPRISQSPGFLFKFSYCELATYLKRLTYNCFLILDGRAPEGDMSVARKVLDIANIILKQDYVFEIKPYVIAPTTPPTTYRINGDDPRVYVRFPNMRKNEAFCVERFRLETISIFDLLEEDATEIQAQLFTTNSIPRVEVGAYVQWDSTPETITTQDISEDECLEIF